ncbi:MAG TPA: hypothetical protein VHM65_01550, partial [Candidatus Lustribacter sp.]|nr:hypothetical protein [Candidatus Lustribacter sp.]
MWLAEDSPAEESIGDRDLTEWRSVTGRAMARAVSRLAGRVATAARANLVLLTTPGAGILLAGGLAALAAGVYDAVTEGDGIAVLDRPALNAAESLRSPGLNHAVTWFTSLGGTV